MSRLSRFFVGGFVVIGGFIALFLFGIRGCLSKYDERSALPPVVYIEKDGKKLLFSLVKFSKTTSYSQSGGFIHKSVSDEYYLQTNDAITGKKIGAEEIDLPSRITQYPIEVLGTNGSQVWIFANELMLYDAFTLKKLADIKSLEKSNAALSGKFPAERRYYDFVTAESSVKFTATDGTPWILDAKTLLAKPFTAIKEDTEKAELASRIKSLERYDMHFSQMKLNQDTLNREWFGLYSTDEFNALNDRVYINSSYGEDERRQLLTARSDSSRYGQVYIDKKNVKQIIAAGYYLDGGFLLNKQTGQLLHPENSNSYLVVSKSQIGNEGSIIISCVSPDGYVAWKYDTELSQWTDWQYKKNRLYIYGRNNKDLSSGEINLLIIVNLKDGSTKRYDYFTDKSLN
ncbi:PA2928 family protein [Ferruginibacter sp. HRS2-29]|uniref:PA2928 family protein n=1 Tax=Ferruginibacter sp. HRS2-29 TaxID=2487334 RepID=UPI0020CED1B7|nr:PA2928 family protein [Ferruginibacter sp. HRS2-29]MCP9749688.1 hypothetical protein [Ferruginibacter sp. HRS2-29]